MPLQTFRSRPLWSQLTWVLVALTFVADVFTPPTFGVASLYLLAILLGVFFHEKNDVLLLAVATTMLTIAGVVVGDRTAPIEQMLLDRLTIVVGLWAAAYFVIHFIALRSEEEGQQEKFKALFHHATQGILLADRNGKIVIANPAAESLFQYKSGAMEGLMVEALIPRRYAQRHLQHREHYQGNPHARAMGIGLNLYGLRHDGTEFPVEVSLSPFKGQGGDFTVAFVIDNTIRKNYEDSILDQRQELANLMQALRELNENLEVKVAVRTAELEQAKKDLTGALEKERELGELKSRFVSMASHEFRTPLSAVLSSASLISSYVDRQDLGSIKKHTERIKNAVNGLNTILTEFLSLGKLEEGHIRPKLEAVSLPESVRDVANEMKSLFKHGQTFLHQHEGPETITLDPGLLKNVLINLISNAIKYSPEDGHILVETNVDGERARIAVRDQGIGIPESEQKHLFDRFFRATNAVNIHGTGLGLYIVRRYVEMMEGRIGFTSGLNKGTEVWVEFPITSNHQVRENG
jgi:PAS domain S-box-containing protein